MAFPTSPTNGQTATVNGVVYTYNSTLTAWTVGTEPGGNVSGNVLNITSSASIGTTLIVTGNITGGNVAVTGVSTAANYSATGNITGGNVAVTGVSTAANYSATGNITGGNIVTGGVVKLAAASGGSIELVPTNTASNFTVTVPAVTGTMLTNKTAGTVLQVVSSTFSTAASTTSTTYVDSAVSLGITLASASNKVLMLFNGGHGYVASGYSNGLIETICRQSSATYSSANDLANVTYGMTQIYNSTNLNTAPHSMSYLDTTPGSATPTYRIFFRSRSGGSVVFCEGNSQMSFTLMEIAA